MRYEYNDKMNEVQKTFDNVHDYDNMLEFRSQEITIKHKSYCGNRSIWQQQKKMSNEPIRLCYIDSDSCHNISNHQEFVRSIEWKITHTDIYIHI